MGLHTEGHKTNTAERFSIRNENTWLFYGVNKTHVRNNIGSIRVKSEKLRSYSLLLTRLLSATTQT